MLRIPSERKLGTVGAALAILMSSAGPATAQQIIDGLTRSDQSDVSHVSVTSGDLVNFEPGTRASFTCAVAWGVRTTSDSLVNALAATALREPDGSGAQGALVPAGVQRDLLVLMNDTEGSDEAETRLIAGLAPESNRSARRAVRALTGRLRGLARLVGEMDPASPGTTAPIRIRGAVAGYNDFLDASSRTYLASEPAELLAVRSVLSSLVSAAIENQWREADPGSTPAGQLACAPPLLAVRAVTAPAPAPAPVPDREISICLVRDEGPIRIAALVRPETGDTFAVVDGERRTLAEAYPPVALATTRPWFVTSEPIELGEDRYLRYGLPRSMDAGTLALTGRHDGVPIYAAPGV